MSEKLPPAAVLISADLQQLRSQAHYAVLKANKALVLRGWDDPVYVAGRQALDQVMVLLNQAKWGLGRIDGTYADFQSSDTRAVPAEAVADGFETVRTHAEKIAAACLEGRPPEGLRGPALESHGAEILFAGEVPLVPTICPVVVLAGSNRDMGRQYARQVIEIYGEWIFRHQAQRSFGADEASEIAKWEEQLARHAPDILDFVRGWAEGASDSGVPMSYQQVLAIWTGTLPPSNKVRPMALALTDAHNNVSTAAYLGVSAAVLDHDDMCSGACAWGEGTPHGKLVAGATTDHDCTFQATIIAYPESGNSFIYTPFSVNGSIPVLGRFFMAGHPGMNSRGLAYVHHGGANTGEPREEWGYGLRRGSATFHLLQFAATAAEARDIQIGWPVGDTAISLGTVGGLFADAGYGCSIEARPGSPHAPAPIIREATYDALGRGYSFLYATNNAIDPRSRWLNAAPAEGCLYNLAGGWHTFDPKAIFSGDAGEAFRRLSSKNSEGRNRQFYASFMAGYGRIDATYMMAVYRHSGAIPHGDYDEVCAEWHKGAQWNCSAAHRANAFTVVMEPDAVGTGKYHACVGPANRAVACRDPGHGYYYFDETNAFWTLTLAATPEEVAQDAGKTARSEIGRADRMFEGLSRDFAGRTLLGGYLDLAKAALKEAEALSAGMDLTDRDARLARLAKMTRCFTRAQVRARQVIEAIQPPPTDPKTLVPAFGTVAAARELEGV
ncbi:hypothetical protein EZH22_25260 [Xanthobacter dioxanivorans]|uniref:Uncharacterized protein n=1 Tax=Xanthobacter dioxanivorans TaxID=2528964 RepID=A0A974PN22_9HYPH|nr:hypothetical protein [Xanthobacter dioxanivorans]QRG06241.1 hypothetical protein EZH22_25260 [Xanthobacter dioxanivorans]